MLNNQQDIKEKDEKIAAAKLKLKEFKKRNVPIENQSLDKISDTDQLITNSIVSDSYKLNVSSFKDTDLGFDQIKDQLKLQVQTIGILVAEKTELQSKLNQQIKKCDKRQDECDELTGRLKASRQKITELEKLVQKLESDKLIQNDERNIFECTELKFSDQNIQIEELNQKLEKKNKEAAELIELVSKLKNQIENLQTLNQSNFDEENEKLKAENSSHKNRINELEKSINQQKEEIKNEYQSYVDGLQKQVENLVDQINKLTDEREESFLKIDSLNLEIKKIKEEQTDNKITKVQNIESYPKMELLENEIKYFKQQIDILLKEQTGLQELVENKNKEIDDLNCQINNFENERANFNILVEESHNNKQTISRILKQNNELKKNLEILEEENLKMKDNIVELKLIIENSKNEKLIQIDEKNIENNYDQMNTIKPNSKSLNTQIDELEVKKENTNREDITTEEIKDSSSKSETIIVEGQPTSKETVLNYLNNMKLVEKKFTLVMEENVQLKERNSELEHIIEQLEFETETIVDYITMYQIERGKLNEKYKIKDDFIRDLSSYLNIYKLAFVEINNLIATLISIQDEKNTNKNDEIDQRINFILSTIKKILLDLTQNYQKNTKSSFSESNIPIAENLNEKNKDDQIDEKINKFKTETVICSSCYGDLFII